MPIRRVLVLLALLVAFHARAETLTCTEIQTIPATITTSGTYCLSRNLATNQLGGGGVLINASNVRLDCNHHSISNLNASNEDVGIASGGKKNVVVENCQINGFQEGIHFDTRSYNVMIRNNTVQNAQTYGILIWGSKVQVVGNSVLDTRYVSTTRDYNQGIYLAPYAPGQYSRDVIVRGNRVLGVTGTSSLQAIRVDMAYTPIIQGNHVSSLVPKTGGTAYAIMVDAINPLIAGNTLMSASSSRTFGIAVGSNSVCAKNYMVGLTGSGLQSCGLAEGNIVK